MNQEQLAQIRYDCVLPAAIFFNKNLCPACIKLYAMVRNLTKAQGYCFATNSYLSKLLETDKRTIQRQLASLKDEGYLEIYMGKIGKKSQRKIYLSNEFQKFFTDDKNVMGGVTKMSPIKEKNINKYSSSPSSPSLSRSDPVASPSSDNESPGSETLKLAEVFSSSLKAFNPKALIDEREIVEGFASMKKEIQSVGVEEMCASIKFLFETGSKDLKWWRTNCSSASFFKKNFNKIMNVISSFLAQKNEESNRKLAKSKKKQLKEASKSNQFVNEEYLIICNALDSFQIDDKGVFHKKNLERVNFSEDKTGFIDKLSKIFNVDFR